MYVGFLQSSQIGSGSGGSENPDDGSIGGSDGAGTDLSGVLGWLDSIAKGIGSLAESIKNGIRDVLIEIFVPDEDFITGKIEELKSEFGFVALIIDSAQQITSIFMTNSFSGDMPVVTINLGNAESKYNYGGVVTALDFSWFARYKPTTDAIISGILWLLFIWRIFVKLPGIINGSSGADDSSGMGD